MMRRLTLAIVVASILVALGMSAAQAAMVPPLTIPSGTEVMPHITYDANGNSLVKLFDPATGKDETISSTEGTDSFLWRPQLSEDGKKVFFLDYHDFSTDPEINDRQESIGFMPSDGGARSRIVTGPINTVSSYDLSRDGSKVVYVSSLINEEGNFENHVFTAPVKRNARPTEVPIPSDLSQSLADPIFNEEGTGIFFTGDDPNDPSRTGGQLYHMNLNGTGLTQLTNFTIVTDPETGNTVIPAGHRPEGKELSPDGNTIVYHGFLDTDGTAPSGTGIYTLPVSGGTPTEVAVPTAGESDVFEPHYNHDGSRIAYTEFGAEDPTTGTTFEVYSVPAGGGDRQLLAEGLPDGAGNWEIVNYKGARPRP